MITHSVEVSVCENDLRSEYATVLVGQVQGCGGKKGGVNASQNGSQQVTLMLTRNGANLV